MAKRASLKDKGAETLGLTPKKGKGIDVLFGGPMSSPATSKSTSIAVTAPATIEETPMTNDANDLSGLMADTPAPAVSVPLPPTPAAPAVAHIKETLPVNEADHDDNISDNVVDELGLPVAMEGPPPDLLLALPVAEVMPVAPSLPPPAPAVAMPVAMPVPPAPAVAMPTLPVMPVAMPVAPSPPPTMVTVSPPVVSPSSDLPQGEADNASDLSGLAEDDLSGLDDTSGPATAVTIPPANLPPATPPVSAAPRPVAIAPVLGGYASAASTTPTYRPTPAPPPVTSYSPPSTYTAQPAPLATPPSTATGAPSLSMPRAKIESIGGIASEPIKVKEEDIMPEDTQLGQTSSILELKQREKVAKDTEIARQVTRYIGKERREKLDQDIENLYNQVASELSVNTEDAEFALKVLSQAQDIVFEDTRQYDEALYLVAIVRTMIARKRNLLRWSYTWGSFVFFYAVVWIIAFLAGFLFDSQLKMILGDASEYVLAVRAAWFSALAGGIGGVIGILYSLYWHVAMKQDFDRQYIMYYMVQPIMGFILGAVVYFIIGSGFLVVNLAIDRSANTGTVLASPTIIAIQIVFGWIAGFRQRFVFEMIDKIVQRVSPKPEGDEGKKPAAVISAEDRGRIEARLSEREARTSHPAPPAESQAPETTTTTPAKS
jgi:hypothetical protein